MQKMIIIITMNFIYIYISMKALIINCLNKHIFDRYLHFVI